jgi:hypothetical protein
VSELPLRHQQTRTEVALSQFLRRNPDEQGIQSWS